MRLGFVGAGRMGRPMVDRLVAAGHEVSVLARTRQARDDLETAGAHPVADAKDAARGAAVACVCVFSDEQVRQVCLDGALLARLPIARPRATLLVAALAVIVGATGLSRLRQEEDILIFLPGGDPDVAALRTASRCASRLAIGRQ